MVVTGDNVVVEQGNLTQVENDRTLWAFVATKNAQTDHVKIIVDAADLTSQVTKETAEKEV